MIVLAFVIAAITAATTTASSSCSLTTQEKRENARLSFEAFDQAGDLPSTSRKLAERGCYRASIDAAESYLLLGPPRSDYQQRVIVWHMAQSTAMAGDERRAASLIAATRVPMGNNENLDWNSYVQATWAFLVKDRATFDQAAATLAKSGRAPDITNSSIVTGMGRCWNKPYRIAYDSRCGT